MTDDVGEGLHGLFQRRGSESSRVGLIEVHVVGLLPLQRAVDGFHDVFAGQPVAGLPVCTHRVEAQQRLRLSFEIGQYLPPLRGASAHLLLVALPAEGRRKYVQEALIRGDRPPLAGVEEFLAEVQRDSERGWAVSSAEIDEGVWSAAAIIRSEGKFIITVGALSDLPGERGKIATDNRIRETSGEPDIRRPWLLSCPRH